MLRGAEGDSMGEPIVSGGVAGLFLATVAWFFGWLVAQVLAMVRRVR